MSVLLILISCNKDEVVSKIVEKKSSTENKVLILKVDFTTNTFESGKELTFENQTTTFTAIPVVQSNQSDGGYIAVFYQELNEKLFEVNQGFSGNITFPTDFLSSSSFNILNTLVAIPFPSSGFENIYNPNNQVFDYNLVWQSIASLEKVNQYRLSNPNATVKLFLIDEYGSLNANTKKWILILKN